MAVCLLLDVWVSHEAPIFCYGLILFPPKLCLMQLGKPVQFILACDSCPRFSPSSLFAQKPCDPFLDQKFQFNPPFFSSYVMSTEADKKTNGVTASDDDTNDDDEQRVKGAKCKLSMKVGQSSRTFCLARLLNGVL